MGFTFLVPAHPGSPGQRAVKCVCVCVSKTTGNFDNLVETVAFIVQNSWLNHFTLSGE